MGEKDFEDKTVLLEKLRAGVGDVGRWSSSPHSPSKARTGEQAPQIKYFPEAGKRRLGDLLEPGLQVARCVSSALEGAKVFARGSTGPTRAIPLPIAVNQGLRPGSAGYRPRFKGEGSCGLLKGA